MVCYCFLAFLLLQNLPSDTNVTLVTMVDNYRPLLDKQNQVLSVPLGIVRLGNHLFKYSAGYGIAKDRGVEFCVEQPTFRFSIFKGPFVKQCRTKPDYKITENKFGFCDKRFYKPYEQYKHIGIRRYFQCFEYFNKYKQSIQKIFEIKDTLKEKATKYLQQLIRKNDTNPTLTCFHYRLGDMTWNNEGMTLPSKEYYLKVIHLILKQGGTNMFLIISDEPKKAKKYLSYIQNYSHTIVSHADLHTDFTMMATLCDNIVFSRGTFAWWAAYLNKKATVYYRDEFKNNYMTMDVNRDTYYLPEWIHVK